MALHMYYLTAPAQDVCLPNKERAKTTTLKNQAYFRSDLAREMLCFLMRLSTDFISSRMSEHAPALLDKQLIMEGSPRPGLQVVCVGVEMSTCRSLSSLKADFSLMSRM